MSVYCYKFVSILYIGIDVRLSLRDGNKIVVENVVLIIYQELYKEDILKQL